MKNFSHLICGLVVAAIFCICLNSSVSAQEITGAINGTVRDANGAAVSGATITIRDSTKIKLRFGL